MAASDVSAFAMMSALRDQIATRITASEDFRAFVALSRELSAFGAQNGSAEPPAETVPDGRDFPRIVRWDRR